MFQISAIHIGGNPSRDHVIAALFEDRADAEADALARNCKPHVPFYFQVEEREA